MVGRETEKKDTEPQTFPFRSGPGISEKVIRNLSREKNEPEWMLGKRLEGLSLFESMPLPSWGPDLSGLDLSNLHYYLKATDKKADAWEDVPDDIRKTFDRLGIPEAERKFLAGSAAQYESEMVYHRLKKQWAKKGIIFTDMDTALQEHADIVKKYFGTVVPSGDNKFSALNTAAWSGGSFIYVPEGVQADVPLQTYFRINAEKLGQFERSLVIAEEGSAVNYIEGCSAPVFSKASLHAAVVEVIAKKNSKLRFTTIQNWSSNVYNLVTKRCVAGENAVVEWLDGNMGSRVTMKYPAVILRGKGARAELLGMTYAGRGQVQDVGAKAIHIAPGTHSKIVSKSVCQEGGRSSFRGLVHVDETAEDSGSFVQCNAYLLDDKSRTDTYPRIVDRQNRASVSHEAKVGSISREKLFYLMSRGISEKDALSMVVLGFMESFTKELPMEYAVELNRLIQLQMEGSVG
ncbi:Fe-S cluster assembly protein SufB [Candidatus Micrarchaeota archaeon]|nr:Fe-S cluster assembly protein SufB [Candidatus Micrarchaeota archaeon]